MEKYNGLIHEMDRHMIGNMVIIEFVKECGYTFFIQMYLNSDIATLYTVLCLCLETTKDKVKIILRSENLADIYLSTDNVNTVIRDLRVQFPDYIKPIYPIPARLVYRMHVDDGHVH